MDEDSEHRTGFRRGFHHMHWRTPTVFMSVEEEVQMLEKAKEALETQLNNINSRLEKLKA
jgi:hypothetical protein